jgi:hypothetical protein
MNEDKIAALAAQGDVEAKKYIQSQKQLSMQERMTAAMGRFSIIMENIYYTFIGIGVALAAMTFGLSALPAIGAGILGGIAVQHIGGTQMANGGFVPYKPGGTVVTMSEQPGTTGEHVVKSKDYDRMLLAANGVSENSKQTTQVAPIINVSVNNVVGPSTIREIGNQWGLMNNLQQGVGNTYNRV